MGMVEKASVLLERQHRDIDAALRLALEDADDRDRLGRAMELLRHHIFLEETILFPMLQHPGLETPIYVMKYEHGEMWSLLEALDAGCREGRTPAALRTQCQALCGLLRVHNPKEEQVIYPAGDEAAVSAAGQERLMAELGSAVMPDGWRCEIVPDGSLGAQE